MRRQRHGSGTARSWAGRTAGWARRTAVLAAVLGPGLGLGLLQAPQASAGGPTSVLITSPSRGEVAALSGSDARYRSLERLLGPGGKGTRTQPSSSDGSVGTRQVNVTWMALDLQPTRTDRVFPGEDRDTVWIHTATGVPDSYKGYWHRAAEPGELVRLLKELGLMGRADGAKAAPALFPEPWESQGPFGRTKSPEPAATPASALTPRSTGSSTHGRLDRWWWAIPGLVAGSLLTLAALQPRSPGRRRSEHRQELLEG
ncbi:hypothetical protein [Streptomyces sp. NPDC057428]|uniref:hypothetical protein n=1 Tax=Streptomyces sp. NPDC057428 TaxID=3346129 RepID=UPI0036883947